MKRLGINCFSVDGFVKESSLTPNTANHTWNVVNLGRYYYLVDCSKASESSDSKCELTEINRNRLHLFFLFPLPSELIRTHFPEEDFFALIEGYEFSHKTLRQSPVYYLPLTYSGVTLKKPLESFNIKIRGYLCLKFQSS